jgi:hypothetical protein
MLEQKRFWYGQRLLKNDGSAALPWEAFRRVEDTRIRPRQSRQNTFDVLLPPRLRGSVKIRGRLLFGLISEAMSRRLNLRPPDPILATSVETTVSLGTEVGTLPRPMR